MLLSSLISPRDMASGEAFWKLCHKLWWLSELEDSGLWTCTSFNKVSHGLTPCPCRGYPTIKYFPAGPKLDAEEYDGGRTAGDIVTWVENKAESFAEPPEIREVQCLRTYSSAYALSLSAYALSLLVSKTNILITTNHPTPVQLLNDDIFKEECREKSICLVSILPDILDTGKTFPWPHSLTISPCSLVQYSTFIWIFDL